MYSNKELSSVLKKNHVNTGFIDKLKIVYRPYICPFDTMLELIEPGKKVFDIGCGSGMFLSLIAHFKAPTLLGGTEISDNLVSNARVLLNEYSVPSSVFLYDGKTLPQEIEQFDYIILNDVYHHIPVNLQKQFITDLYSKMKKGAVLLFKDIDASSLPWVYFNKLHDLFLGGGPGNEISFQKAEQLLKENGFHIEQKSSERIFWYPHYMLVVRKN